MIIYDVNDHAIQRSGISQVTVAATRAELVSGDIDVYSPCALGGALDEATVGALRARVICGGANNQLAHPGVDKLLTDHGILYAPDYVVNAGGVIQVADEIEGFNFERAKANATQIFGTTKRILAMAGQEGMTPAVAADRLAERTDGRDRAAARNLARRLKSG